MRHIVFMGTPESALASLKAVAEHPGSRLAGVFSQVDKPVGRGRRMGKSPVRLAAEELGVPVITPAKSGDPEAMAALQRWRPDLIVVCAYGRILPRRVLDLPPLGCYNLHFSLLPRWRGASPVQAAILAGDEFTGVSLQRMVFELDAGAIVAESDPVKIGSNETATTLAECLAEVSARLIADSLAEIFGGHAPLRQQDIARITTCGVIRKEQGSVDWSTESAIEIERKHRAYTPWPGCYSYLGTRRLGLTRMELTDAPRIGASSGESAPVSGTIGRDGIVPAKLGWLRLLEVQPEGKKAMPFSAFRNGNPWAIGGHLTPAPVE